ncbi:Mu transposase C-terminal domain-containing protein [Haemophilus parahaemolyticus]
MELIGTSHKRVVVRYAPANLHNKVWVYALGEYLAETEITEKQAMATKWQDANTTKQCVTG